MIGMTFQNLVIGIGSLALTIVYEPMRFAELTPSKIEDVVYNNFTKVSTIYRCYLFIVTCLYLFYQKQQETINCYSNRNSNVDSNSVYGLYYNNNGN